MESKCYGLKKELEALNNKTHICEDIQERLDDLLKKIGSENLMQNADEEELLLEEIVKQFEYLKKKMDKSKIGKTLDILISCHLYRRILTSNIKRILLMKYFCFCFKLNKNVFTYLSLFLIFLKF